ncbi:MAG: aspartate 1-decarboxylase [Planctomycetes bacterium RIFCSPHIGHO2_02_FULL_50_42]|nr:MAG: aspartate 1-decarboxylase [Planctomycetes bacterium GWA2_50_13]OHB89315.1 MAG: aspartate 1-decarboxylase [Planctomycetes bacterium RIFCSPHIGHO2_02_FULL_50_42]OHB91999.1 MAG: aspartate 1-decarboxylase [Planctomycetes bacterium RIFCSPHIGHO2_12_FULL_51_37]OHB96125.1 MAG: aspartate 1-decarboxylase [Planctomycetes bacterium RIFCSPLOWO2_02_FULL_50_16]OHC03664.1 MAG: aspartate 1-decarboxylase [Planctomycetes bacterium RIFCSPLOWO2_12_FULL_50_35]
MYRELCKSKIQPATVTDANLHYQGSITIDAALLEASNIVEYEKVQVLNINNGQRIETYAIEGKRDSGTICLNGAAARWAHPGDKVIIISYCLVEDNKVKGWKPKVVLVDEANRQQKAVFSTRGV